MSDFKVYYSAAKNLLENGPIYNQAFGQASGIYKYSPAALFPFLPFALLPFFIAATFYFAILSFFVFLTIKKITRFAQQMNANNAVPALIPYLILLIGGAHFFRELHLGNINTILLYISLASVDLMVRGKKIVPGVLLGIAVLFKPQFAIVIPLLLFFRLLLPFIIATGTIISGAAVPIIKFGIYGNIQLHKDWLLTMMGHNAPTELIKAPNTLQHLVSLFLNTNIPGVDAMVTLIAIILIYGGIFLIARNNHSNNIIVNYLPLSFFVCIAAIPNITFTDTEHFLLVLPLLGYVLSNFSQRNITARITIVFACVFYGGNWFDLWGRTLSEAFQHAGILGIGNATIIVLALHIWTRSQKASNGTNKLHP